MKGEDKGLGSRKYERKNPRNDDKYFGPFETPIMISRKGMMTDDEVAIDGHGRQNICGEVEYEYLKEFDSSA